MVAAVETRATQLFSEGEEAFYEEADEQKWDDFLTNDETEEDEKIAYEDSDSDLDIPEDPYQVRTEKTFVNNPYNKGLISLALVGSSVFLGIHFVRLLMAGYVTTSESKPITTSKVLESEESSIFSEEELTSTNGDDLEIHQALNQQSHEIKEVEKFNQAVKPVIKSPPPQVKKVSQPQQPVPSPTPVKTVSYTPPPRSVTPTPRPVVEKQETKLDPMEQWLLAANMGSYGATNFDAQQVSYNNSYNKALNNYSAQSNPRKVVSVSYRGESSFQADGIQLQKTQPRSQLYANAANKGYSTRSQKQFLRGTSVEGELELPIVWMSDAGKYNQQRDYLIRLKEPLVGGTGEELAPKGSMAVVKAQQFYGDTGFIQLEVTSLIIEKGGNTQEYSIPANSVVVLDEDGGILSAKAEKASNVSGEAAAFFLSGISRAVSVLNNPTSTTYSPFGSSTSYGDGNVLSGFIEGATSSAVNSINQRQASAINRPQLQSTVYVIDGGTKVQLVVNKSFSLEK